MILFDLFACVIPSCRFRVSDLVFVMFGLQRYMQQHNEIELSALGMGKLPATSDPSHVSPFIFPVITRS